jgi:phosphoenolpyruvate carboxylase
MDELSAAAFAAYRNLVYETDGFEQYFWESTVIAEIAALNIGSRPASRKKSTAIEDLRAIPWVFSWAQCRIMLPGWYGFGSAVEAYRAKHGEAGMARLKAMHHEWSFFATALQHGHGARQERHRHRQPLRRPGEGRRAAPGDLPAHRGRARRTVETLLQISGQADLLDANPLLKRSIRNRFPTSTRSTTCRSSCSTATGTATRTSACAAASTCRSTASRRACATAAEGAP